MLVAERGSRAEPPAGERPASWSMASAAVLHIALVLLLLGAGGSRAPMRYATIEFRALPVAEEEEARDDEALPLVTDGEENVAGAGVAAPPSTELASGGAAPEPALETASAPPPEPAQAGEEKGVAAPESPPPMPRAKPVPPVLASAEAPPAPEPPASDAFSPPADALDARAADGGGDRGSPDRSGSRYLSLVRAEIERQRLYPAGERGSASQGTAVFALVVDRDGRLLVLELTKSSGAPVLDNAGAEMIRRAAPLPPLPPEIPGEAVELEVALRLSAL